MGFMGFMGLMGVFGGGGLMFFCGVEVGDDFDCLAGFADVVDAEQLSAREERCGMEGDGACQGAVGGGLQQLIYHRFAGDGHQERFAREETFQIREAGEEFVVVFQRFGETESRVDDDVGDPQGVEAGEALREELGDLGENVVVVRVILHVVGCAAVVHQDVRHLEFGDGFEHSGVEVAASDIVDHIGAREDRVACRQGEAGVDRDDGLREGLADEAYGMDEALRLDVGAQQGGAGASRDHADVDDVGALVEELTGASQQLVVVEIAAAVIERVGRDVEDAHDGRTVELHQALAEAQHEGRKRNISTHNNKITTGALFNCFYANKILQMTKTEEEFQTEIQACRDLFEKKSRDYGTSWRILRLPSLTDQIFIKASRIRSIEETGENKIGDSTRGEYIAMVNYAVIALIQMEMTDADPEELPLERTMALYDKHLQRTVRLMLDKNHDYGEAWRQMRVSSMTDLILMKLKRIKQIEDNQGKTLVSEGVEGGYMDIINYSLFCLIRMTEGNCE